MALVETETCASCGQPKGAKHKATTLKPSTETMMEWTSDGMAEATDGCSVEPDGVCEHGHSSWMLVLGVI